jgi:hypothetical protein
MDTSPVTWETERMPGGILRIAFAGRGGWASEGNSDGERMRQAIDSAVVQSDAPSGLVIDLRSFEYRFGNWIAAAALIALRRVGNGRVCVVATGETATALQSLWNYTNYLNGVIPPLSGLDDALLYLSGSREHAGNA